MKPMAALTEAQSGLWYAQRLDPGNPIFNTGHSLELTGPLDRERFEAAANQAVREADALSLRMAETDAGPRQFVDEDFRPWLTVVDLSRETDPASAVRAAMQADMQTPIDPTRTPLARQVLYAIGPTHHVWYVRVHHLAIDGYGMSLLMRRAAELYAHAGSGQPFQPLQSVWAEDELYRGSATRTADAAFWRDALAGMEDVVGMAQGRAFTAHSCHRVETRMPADALAGLASLAKETNLTWPDVLTGLVTAYCRRFSGTPEISVGVPYMGRLGSASARVPATIMNVLPLRVAPDENAPLAAYLIDVAKAQRNARRHGRYRSEQMRRDLGQLGGNRRLFGPLINVLPFDDVPVFRGLEASMDILGTGPVDDITFTFRGDGVKNLTLEVEANPDLYSLAETTRHATRLAKFLQAAVQAHALKDVQTATAEEAYRELEAFNATQHPVPDTTLTALLEQGMRSHPESIAAVFGKDSISYRELDRRSVALAAALCERGAKADAIVAIALPRSLELIVALVAVLRAGAAYLPLDLDHPPQRLQTILESAKPVAVLAFSNLHGLFSDKLLAASVWPAETKEVLAAPAPQDAAYVIYTSGSTGTPKGVVVEHRAIVNRLMWMGEHYAIAAGDRILQKTPATFDVSVWEFFLPLIKGATLVVAPPDVHRDPTAIVTLIREYGITTLHFVPSMLAAFLDEPSAKGLAIARVFCSGEELSADLRDRFHATLTAELHNLYGPTEAAVDVSYWPAGPDDQSRPIPIGHAVWNTRLVLLDDNMQPTPPGAVGHLFLGGVQLARGYLGRPDLTADRFIPDPFHEGERLYRTGDLARRREDGAVVFLGRADHQVKIRGLRIELGEIEAAIASSGMTRSNIVLAREDLAGTKRLVAYVVVAENYSADALRAHLAGQLPEYMVPSAFVPLDSMPVTVNGKLDRNALPAPSFDGMAGGAPESAAEKTVAALFADLLGRAQNISAEDDFFALGGDSLLAVRLMQRLKEKLGRDPGLGALFEHPTVAGLAAQIDKGAAMDSGLAPLILLASGEEKLAPLFFVHPAGGITWGYRGLARAISPRRMVYGLQAPALDPSVPPPQSIDALAADYAVRIVAKHPDGPYHLAGWSVGGIIAQAIAVQLKEQGKKVGLVAMLDSYPAECWRAEPEPDRIAALRALLAIAGYDPLAHPELDTRDSIVEFLRNGDSALGNLPAEALDGVVRVVLDTNRLVRDHHHRRYDGTLMHIRAANDHKDRNLSPAMWDRYAANLDLIDVPFLHPQLTGADATAHIAPVLDARMAGS